jgi:non-specific serine/threonine protein kinase/serine/threonine-protein kinase
METALVFALAAALTVASVVALRQYRAANRRFNEVRTIANSFLFDVYDAVADQPGTTKARAIVAQRAQQYLDVLARDRSSDLAVRRELATAYGKLADILGQPFAANLGDTAGALRNYRKAAEVLEGIAASGHQDAGLFTALGEVYAKEGQIADRQLAFGEAVAAGEKGVRARERAVALDPRSMEARRALVNGTLFLALAHGGEGKARNDVAELRTAESLDTTALAAARQLSQRDPTNESLQILAAKACEYLAYHEGDLAGLTGDREYYARALSHQQEHVDIVRPLYTRNPDRYRRYWADALADLSRDWLAAGDGRQSEAAARQGLREFREIAAGDPNNYEAARDVYVAHWDLARALSAQNRTAEAAAEFQAVLSGYEQAHQRNPEDRTPGVVAESRDWLAANALAAGNRTAAIAGYRRNIDTLAESSNPFDVVSLALDREKLGNALLPVDKAQAAACYAQAATLWDRLRDSRQLPPMYAGKAAELRQKLPR